MHYFIVAVGVCEIPQLLQVPLLQALLPLQSNALQLGAFLKHLREGEGKEREGGRGRRGEGGGEGEGKERGEGSCR